MLTTMRLRLRLLVRAVVMVVLSAVSLALFVVTVTALALVTVWVGIPVLLATTALARRVAAFRRRWSCGLIGADIPPPYLRIPAGGLLVRFRAQALDPAVRRDVYWLFVDGVAGLALACVGVVEAVFDLLLPWLPAGLAIRGHAHLDRALLDVSEKSRLALRVEQLTESRAETVDSQASELRRIERDLHDGAQARLVGLGMSLALAEELVDTDPRAARALLAEARMSSIAALVELRDLVRGILPPVLADRGLVGAVQALALNTPVPVHVTAELTGRLAAPVESAAYFAIAEALTNIVKHSGATAVEVHIVAVPAELAAAADDLRVTVRDDGRGGADARLGTGLRGIERRLAAFDGTLELDSPPGGGTTLVMVLPCASSSPKTLPSSGTA